MPKPAGLLRSEGQLNAWTDIVPTCTDDASCLDYDAYLDTLSHGALNNTIAQDIPLAGSPFLRTLPLNQMSI